MGAARTASPARCGGTKHEAAALLAAGRVAPTPASAQPGCIRAALDSTALTDAEWCPANILIIGFRSGACYAYDGAPRSAFEALLRADSKGRHFTQHIRDRYPTRLLRAPAGARGGLS